MFYTDEWFPISRKYLPIRYCPLQIELELVTSAEAFSPAAPPSIAAFTLSDIQVLVDLVTLDNSLDNEYALITY